MTRFLHLLLLLIASSLVMSSTVHAREFVGTAMMECSGAVHSEGDADQTQGDSDKAVPHHHGSCHSSAMYVPFDGDLSSSLQNGGMQPMAGTDQILASGKVAPELRPPNA